MKVKNKLTCQTVGDRIRHVRQERNLTQKELGDRTGIAEPTIRRYELGKLNPKYETLEKIAKALGCSAQFLHDGVPKVGDMTTNWKTGKRISFPLEIDSDLLSVLQIIASDEGRTLNEEIEDTLWWKAECYTEEQEDASTDHNVHDWTREEMHAEVDRQFDAEEKETDEPSTGFLNSSGAAIA